MDGKYDSLWQSWVWYQFLVSSCDKSQPSLDETPGVGGSLWQVSSFWGICLLAAKWSSEKASPYICFFQMLAAQHNQYTQVAYLGWHTCSPSKPCALSPPGISIGREGQEGMWSWVCIRCRRSRNLLRASSSGIAPAAWSLNKGQLDRSCRAWQALLSIPKLIFFLMGKNFPEVLT